MFVLKPQSGIPLYRQLADQTTRLIASGRLPPGSTLPSVRELALEHAVNPMTISKAYALLEADGWLERHRGKPMTVAARGGRHASGRRRLRQLEQPVEQLVLAARQLDVEKRDVIGLIDEMWEGDDE